tara:strand:- start:465 stop:617 length:153 start_codon:yes stop_codon:yes gene_type:complete
MNKSLKSRKGNQSLEIDWNIRELFSESAISNFMSEIADKSIKDDKEVLFN